MVDGIIGRLLNGEDALSVLSEVAPKGWEGTVKAMKKHPEIDNPWALAHWMKAQGDKPHYKISKKTGKPVKKQS